MVHTTCGCLLRYLHTHAKAFAVDRVRRLVAHVLAASEVSAGAARKAAPVVAPTLMANPNSKEWNKDTERRGQVHELLGHVRHVGRQANPTAAIGCSL